MESKINIAELLKDCPTGMELDCTMYEDVYFDYIDELNNICCYIKNENLKTSITFNRHGRQNSDIKSKCVIFPKGKTTWEGFVPPYQFKDGDVLTYMFYNKPTIYIYREKGCCNTSYYTGYSSENKQFYKGEIGGLSGDRTDLRLATKEEKEKLFQAIKDNGYRWNAETKTLEKLIEPKFKVGDRIKHRLTGEVYVVLFVLSNGYGGGVYDVAVTNEIGKSIHIKEQDNYELVPNKFDITTLVPFESRVLMRSSNAREWVATFYSHYNNNKFYGCGMCCDQCIPYEHNEHLVGTTNDCDEYYKTWEK